MTTPAMMQKRLRALPLALAVAALLTPHAALGVVDYSDDVFPTFSSDFGIPPFDPFLVTLPGFADDDDDGVFDLIFPGGNELDTRNIDPFDPTAASGVNGLAWDDPEVWRNYESQQNILVGQSGVGTLSITGGSALRFQHLVLGGAAMQNNDLNPLDFGGVLDLTAGPAGADYDFLMELQAGNNAPTTGYGVMTISGAGSLYNNAPQVISTQNLHALNAAGYDFYGQQATPDPGARDFEGDMDGFDVFVGLTGGGELTISEGGAMEIQDSLLVGVGEYAYGKVTIDGPGSRLTAFGRTEYDPTNTTMTSTASMETASMIGVDGEAEMIISAGGQATFYNGLGVGARFARGGELPNDDPAVVGRNSTVTVDGAGSTLRVYATDVTGAYSDYALVVGGFLTDDDSLMTPYLTGTGDSLSVLAVANGAKLRVDSSPDYGSNDADANVAIAYQGQLQMDGGDISIKNRLESDGFIRGGGQIVSSTFYNRALGRIDVGQGESLSVVSNALSGEFFDGDVFQLHTDLDADGVRDTVPSGFYQANVGDINVTGGELRFSRTESPLPPTDRDFDPETQYFRNGAYLLVDSSTPLDDTVMPPTGGPELVVEAIGTITVNDGTLRFEQGLLNTGVVAFTGGDNLVTGRVINSAPIDYDPATDTLGPGGVEFDNNFSFTGTVVISGDETTVTFTDDVINNGQISIGPSENVANFLGDLGGSGTFAFGAAGGADPSAAIVVSNTVDIQGGEVVFNLLTADPVEEGFTFALLSAGELSDETQFTDLDLPALADGTYWDVVYDLASDEVYLEVVASAATGADFTGNGVVDSDDIDVWIANLGINSGASIIQGDADLDGDVDLDDYSLLMEQVFTGVPVPFLGGGGTPVPEPATLLLAVLALAGGASRRR